MNNTSKVNEPIATRISGPIVTASGMHATQMYEVVQVGSLGLVGEVVRLIGCLLYTSPSPRDRTRSRMPSSA